MVSLNNYSAFEGYYWHSGAIANALAYQGFTAPHTGAAYSEALLFGIGGGAAFGYFFFHYEGYDPQINILTRNTFNLFDPIVERLGITQNIYQTTNASIGCANLVKALEEGSVPIVWADVASLPYNALPDDEGMWGMMPVVVFDYGDGTAHIADRARVGLVVTAAALDSARARVKKDKFRVITLEAPNPDKLPAAVTMGIWDCIKLFTEKPPRGSVSNFGFAGYRAWIEALSKESNKKSWAKRLPGARDWYAGLLSAYSFSQHFGKDTSGTAERSLFADFLDEAALILGKTALVEVAGMFGQAGHMWQSLGRAMLPDENPILKRTRELLDHKHRSFLENGGDALPAITEATRELKDLMRSVESTTAFTISERQRIEERLAAQIEQTSKQEAEAINALKDMMS